MINEFLNLNFNRDLEFDMYSQTFEIFDEYIFNDKAKIN
jgi:hypothetical protein